LKNSRFCQLDLVFIAEKRPKKAWFLVLPKPWEITTCHLNLITTRRKSLSNLITALCGPSLVQNAVRDVFSAKWVLVFAETLSLGSFYRVLRKSSCMLVFLKFCTIIWRLPIICVATLSFFIECWGFFFKCPISKPGLLISVLYNNGLWNLYGTPAQYVIGKEKSLSPALN